MNEIVKAGLVGGAFLGGVALLVSIMTWLSKRDKEIVFKVVMWIFGIVLVIAFSIIVGSVLTAGVE